MTHHPARSTLALAIGACLMATAAQAQEASYNYLGASIGQARAKVDESRIVNSMLDSETASTGITRDERDTGYRLFMGRQFSPYLALELGYFNLGNFHFNATTAPAGTLRGEMAVQGGGLDLVGGLPLGAGFKAIARVGAQYAKTRDRFGGTGAVVITNPTPSDRDTNLKVGLGMEYEVNSAFSWRIEMDRYRMSDGVGGHGRVNMVSMGVLFPFGRAPQSVRAAYVAPYVPAPMPVAAAAPAPAPTTTVIMMPAPVVVAASPMPAKVVPPLMRVSFAAESLFGFDNAALRTEGKGALDTFARELGTAQFSVITVEGHTDRLGTVEYNQKLSEERANAVKAYLVTEGRIDPAKIKAVGKSESMPVTKAEDCKGQVATPALIACLQPDRRVDVEVSAMQ